MQIAKDSRHFPIDNITVCWNGFYNHLVSNRTYIRQGLILAKAVRLEKIVQVSTLNSGLEERISIDDILTSFTLKVALYDTRSVITENNIKEDK